MPVAEIVAPDAVLGFWTPDTHLEVALAAVKEWGFTYRHLYPWTKFKDPPPEVEELLPADLRGAWRIISRRPQLGLGHYMRKVHEVALICTRGRPSILDHAVPSACVAPRTRHSQKPVDLHVALERLCAGPRLELFARSARPGWTVWGNEAPGRAA